MFFYSTPLFSLDLIVTRNFSNYLTYEKCLPYFQVPKIKDNFKRSGSIVRKTGGWAKTDDLFVEGKSFSSLRTISHVIVQRKKSYLYPSSFNSSCIILQLKTRKYCRRKLSYESIFKKKKLSINIDINFLPISADRRLYSRMQNARLARS